MNCIYMYYGVYHATTGRICLFILNPLSLTLRYIYLLISLLSTFIKARKYAAFHGNLFLSQAGEPARM